MRYILFVALVLAIASTTLAAPTQGTIETGIGGNIHLSPDPTQIILQMYAIYYLNQMFGLGVLTEIQKTGEYESGSSKIQPATHYALSAFVKVYLPTAMAQGKMRPFVGGGFGLRNLPKGYTGTTTLKEETESKPEFGFRVGFDWWVTSDWTFWVTYHGSKIFVDSNTYFDEFGNDLSDLRSDIRVGISTFITK